jgi:hypothetical protein
MLPDAPALTSDVWDRLLTTIYNEVQSAPQEVHAAIHRAITVPASDLHEQLISYEAWNRFALARANNPHIVRAHVITQLYVSLILVRETLLLAIAEHVKPSVAADISTYLTTGLRKSLRNAVAHGRWTYLDDFSGIEFWTGPLGNPGHTRHVIDAEELGLVQRLCRGTAIAILLALVESVPTDN